MDYSAASYLPMLLPAPRHDRGVTTRCEEASVSNDRPSLAERRAAYAEWRSRLQQEQVAAKALAAEPEEVVPALPSEWSAEALFERSRLVE
jgi:hypothetical protein